MAHGYRLEVHTAAGDLVSILQNAHNIRYTRALNEPHQLTFDMPAEDTALSDVDLANEIWLRDLKDDSVVGKFKLFRESDRRN